MRVLSAKQIKKVEENAFKGQFTEAGLMLAAGTACYERIRKIFKDSITSKRIAVLCGNGKNAGDGFVIADLLRPVAKDVVIVLADKPPVIDEPLMYFEKAVKNGVKVINFTDDCLEDRDILVDCVFGIGFHGEPKAPFDRVFEAVNHSGAKVVSIDTPSGTNATDGSAVKAVHADYTIAISALKYAHVLPPSNGLCGKIYTVNIGIPESCYEREYPQTITKSYVKTLFPLRDKNANKGSYGHLLNICGSYAMPGAAVICAQGALRCGAGLVKCAFPKSIYSVMTSHMIQPLFKPLCENEQKTISIGSLNDIFEELKWADSVVIGCGMGNNDDTQVITDQVIKNSEAPIILDADGINAVAPFIDIIRDRKAPLIMTPHPGEMARLIGESVEYVQSHRSEVAKAFAKENDVILVLKGANTIVTDGKRLYFNTTGNPGMAMGGTGDMLAGMIGAFAAQGFAPIDAAAAAVYIHGYTGDICAAELSQRGMTVEDMLSLLGAVLSEFENLD